MSLTTALSLCSAGSALMGLSPSNCPTGDVENDRQTRLQSNAQTIHRNPHKDTHITLIGTIQQTKGNVHTCLDSLQETCVSEKSLTKVRYVRLH